MKKSSLYEIFKDAGATTYLEYQGCKIPLFFSSVKKEWESVRKVAGVLDLSYRGKIWVSGRDRIPFLNNILSNDIKNLKPGHSCYATFLTTQGKMITDMNVLAFGDYHLLEVDRDRVKTIMEKLSAFVVTEDVVFEDQSNQYGILSIQGPSSEGIVKEFSKKSEDVHAFPNQRTGEMGFDFWISTQQMIQLWNNLQSVHEIQPIGFEAYNVLRIEAGIPWFGIDMNEETIPVEVGLTNAISFTKGCYLGQEAIARIKNRKEIGQFLYGIVMNEEILLSPGDKISLDGKEIGKVTSSAYSFYLKKPIALGYLFFSVKEDTVQINHDHQLANGAVQKLPFYQSMVNNRIG